MKYLIYIIYINHLEIWLYIYIRMSNRVNTSFEDLNNDIKLHLIFQIKKEYEEKIRQIEEEKKEKIKELEFERNKLICINYRLEQDIEEYSNDNYVFHNILEDNNIQYFRCDNCDKPVQEGASMCPTCGENF